MLSSILVKKTNYNQINETERNIKLFLSDLDTFDKMIQRSRNGNRKPIWLSRYNFQSLLNIPSAMQKYGPLINYWEGSLIGEGYLRYVKPKLTSVRGLNWQKNTHTKLLEEVTFDTIIEHYTAEQNSCPILKFNRGQRKPKMYYIYDTLVNVRSVLLHGQPLSMVRLKEGDTVVVVRFGRNCKCKAVSVNLTHSKHITKLNMNCHVLQIDDDVEDMTLEDLDEADIDNYLVALPLEIEKHRKNNMKMNSYYIIDSEWLELCENGKLIRSKYV